MPFFVYKALDPSGAEVTGSLEAADARSASLAVRGRDLRPLWIEPMAGSPHAASDGQYEISNFLPVWMGDKVIFFQQLALMIRSGLTVTQALDAAGGLASSARLRAASMRIKESLLSGESLSAALDREERIFPAVAVQLIRSAEASGELDVVLDRIAVHFEQKATTRSNLITSLIYPTIVVVAAIGVASFLLVGVVPKFAEFFRNSGRALPSVTQALVDVSNAAVTIAPYAAGALLACLLGLLWAYRKPRGRLRIDQALLAVPVVGAIILKASMAQVTWTLAMLLGSGVSLLESVRVASDLCWNHRIKLAFGQAAEDLLSGREFSESVTRAPIPDMVVRLTSAGEKSGALVQVMQELGDHYDKELQSSISRMSNLIEPLLMLLIGGMVGFVYYAFFQAVFSLTA